MKNYKIDILKKEEISALLALQSENLRQNLDAQTVERQGFVSFVYDIPTMEGMMEGAPQIIVKDDDLIIGYALSTTIPYGSTMVLMKPLVDIFEKLSYNDKPLSENRYYIIGQVCVRAGYRGIGIFDMLYEGHKRFLSPRYDFVVTEIANDNKRSLAAHKRIGFKTIHEYYEAVNNKHWHIVLWDFR